MITEVDKNWAQFDENFKAYYLQRGTESLRKCSDILETQKSKFMKEFAVREDKLRSEREDRQFQVTTSFELRLRELLSD